MDASRLREDDVERAEKFGTGLAAGIILDATVIRTLLVPALMRLFGKWNWWLPHPAARVLRVAPATTAGVAVPEFEHERSAA